jgi:replication factor C subunit 3/5
MTICDDTFQSRASPDSIPRPDWEVYIDKLAGVIAKEQSPDKLLEARAMLYELLVHLIPPSVVIVQLMKGLLTRVDDALRSDIIHWAAWYEHRLRLGNKPIFHLEGSSPTHPFYRDVLDLGVLISFIVCLSSWVLVFLALDLHIAFVAKVMSLYKNYSIGLHEFI